MIVKFGILSLKDFHHLIDLDFQAIELACVHVLVSLIHHELKNRINFISIPCHFEYVLAKIVHPLEVADMGVVKRVHTEDFH